MAINVDFSLGRFQSGFCWTNPQAYADALIALLTGTIGGNFNGVIIGSNTPQLTDQDKLWVKLDLNERPVGFFIYQGSWIWPNPAPPSAQERRIWVGSEADLWSYDGGDGTDPSSSAPTDTTGAMWMRDTNFGKDDGSIPFRIPVGAGKNSTAYNSNPATAIGVGDTGGEEQHVLSAAEDPEHQHVFGKQSVPGGPTRCSLLSGSDVVIDSTPAIETVTINPNTAGSVTDGDMITSIRTSAAVAANSHQNMPPYYGVLFIRRTARIYYRGN